MASSSRPLCRIKLRKFTVQRGKHFIDNTTDQPQRMVLGHSLFKIHIGNSSPYAPNRRDPSDIPQRRNQIAITMSAVVFSGLLEHQLHRLSDVPKIVKRKAGYDFRKEHLLVATRADR